MKKLIYFPLLMLIFTSIQSCKKGEEDPFISFRSRKARLTGEWRVSAMDYKEYENNVLQYSETVHENVKTTSNGDAVSYSDEYMFDKDGTFSRMRLEDGESFEFDGNWAFMHKNKSADIEKKEYILIDVTNTEGENYSETSSSFRTGDQYAYQLNKLSNNEIILSYAITFTEIDGIKYKEEYSLTLIKK